MNKKFARLSLTAMLVFMLAMMLTGTALANTPVSGAVYTTVNPDIDGAGHCLNGGPGADAGLVNCNIYDGKQYVWLSGGPDGHTSALAAGTYFFAVLVPSGQNGDPNDGTEKNLSDLDPTSNTGAGDDWTNRVFSVDADGNITYAGTHDFDNAYEQSQYGKIRLMPYDDTTNPGGEYILAVCSLADADEAAEFQPGVDPSDCKYDAFKVFQGEVAQDLVVSKTANPSYDLTYVWSIDKSVDKTTVKQIGGNATFNYTVRVSHDAGTPSNWLVTGQITVQNPNGFDVAGVDVTDAVDNNGTCVVANGTGVTVPGNDSVVLDYTCTFPAEGPIPPSGINTATATWWEGPHEHVSGTASFDFANAAVNAIDDCVTVTDSFAGTLGTVCVGDANPASFTYSRTIPVPANDCLSYDNTATFTTNDTGTTGSDSQTVTVCGPANTGALTIGFWKTTNGQNLIKTYCANTLDDYLAGLGAGSGPFADAAGKNCTQLSTYVQGILTAATATDMNKMLKAQMLGTALDVWFSGPGWTSTKVNNIKPPSNFLSHNNLGTFNMDTTAVCPMVDNSSTGSATCLNNTPSTDAVASGAVPSSPMAMQAILNFASTTLSPFNGSTSSSVWYGGNRTKQEILKNIFDQFNNQLAFGSF